MSLIWGTGQFAVGLVAPSMAGRAGFRRWAARYERASISRSKLVPFSRINAEIDIRQVLPSIYAPTLVMHARGDRLVPFRSGRYLADHIVGARFLELPTNDHTPWFGARDVYLDAMEEFLTAPARMRTTQGSSQLSSSPTSSTRQCMRLALAMLVGANSWTVTMTCAVSRSASAAAAGSRAQVTACWLLLTARAVQSDARGRCGAASDQNSGSR